MQEFLPDHGFYWYVHPAVLVCQTVISEATIEIVDAHNDMIDRALAARRSEIQAAGGLLIFNDWRTLRRFSPGTRHRTQERMKAREPGYARRTVIVVNPANRILRMTIEAANLFKTLISGAGIEVFLSAETAVAQAGLPAPQGGDRFPDSARRR